VHRTSDASFGTVHYIDLSSTSYTRASLRHNLENKAAYINQSRCMHALHLTVQTTSRPICIYHRR